MTLYKTLLLIFLGAGIGGTLRYGFTQLAHTLLPMPFPIGTFLINITGSFAMGYLFLWVIDKTGHVSLLWRSFLLVGILGGYTTFSSFSMDSWVLIEEGRYWLAVLYISGSVILSLLATFMGMWLFRR
jgi:CrcB protein